MISCGEYDYIEMSCLYHYPIRLTMKAKEVIEGIALDTVCDKNHQECIKLEVGKKEILVVLNRILKLEVLIPTPPFTEIIFK